MVMETGMHALCMHRGVGTTASSHQHIGQRVHEATTRGSPQQDLRLTGQNQSLDDIRLVEFERHAEAT